MEKSQSIGEEATTRLIKVLTIQDGVSAEKEIQELVRDDWEFMHGIGNAMVFEKFTGARNRRIRRSGRMLNRLDLPTREQDSQHDFHVMARQLRDAQLTIEARERQLDPDSTKHWDAMRTERDRARVELNELRNIMHELAEALIWASGAEEFQVGNKSSEGWEKGPRVALENYREFMRKLERELYANMPTVAIGAP